VVYSVLDRKTYPQVGLAAVPAEAPATS